MRLRELINRLETLSQGGKNDDLVVEIEDPEDNYQNFCVDNAYITRYDSSNDEYDYVIIKTT
jgi:hypothetical protein